MSADRQLSTESAALQVIMANSMTNIAMWSLPPPMLFSYIPVVLQLFVGKQKTLTFVFIWKSDHLYPSSSAILGTEKLAEDVGSKLLMMIKMLMDKIDQSGSEEDRRGISEVLQSAVSSLLDALISDEDEAEEIDEPSSSAEMALMKNILLTLVVMHTAVPQLCHHPDNLARLCSFLKRTVTHSSEKLALISLQCVKALTISPITSAKPNSIEIAQSVVRSTAPVILSHLYSSASLYSQTMVEGLRIAVEWTVSYQNLLSGKSVSLRQKLSNPFFF